MSETDIMGDQDDNKLSGHLDSLSTQFKELHVRLAGIVERLGALAQSIAKSTTDADLDPCPPIPGQEAKADHVGDVCLTLMLDCIVFDQVLPDGCNLSEVLPPDNETRSIRLPCPRLGCPSVGVIIFYGNSSVASHCEGRCTRPDMLGLEQRANPHIIDTD